MNLGTLLKFGLPVLALAMFALAAYHVSTNETATGTKQPPRQPPVSPYEQTVAGAGAGLIEAESENIEIGSRVPGVVVEVFVSDGDKVQAGDRLFRLDESQLQAQLGVRKAELASAEAELSRLEQQPRPERIPLMEATVEEAKATLAERRDDYERFEDLARQEAATEGQLIDARHAFEAAEARLEKAEADLALLEAGAWEAEIAVARSAVEQAEAAVNATQTELDRLVTHALVDGEVLQVNIRPGEFVNAPPAGPLVLLGSLEQLHVRVDIDEYDIPRFDPGAPATGMLKGRPDLDFPLRFVSVEPYVIPKQSLTGRNTERVDTRVLQAIYAVEPNANNPTLYVGQQVDVFIKADGSGSVSSADGSADRDDSNESG